MSIATRIQSMYENVGEVYDTITNVTLPEHKNIENIPRTIRDSYLEIINNGINVIYDNWEKVVGEGTSLTLTPTEEAPMKIVYKGNTYQYSTSGKNVFDEKLMLNATGWVLDSNGYYTGTTSNLRAYFNSNQNIISFEENTRYTFSFIGYKTGATENARIRIYYTDNTYTDMSHINETTPTEKTIVSDENKTIKYMTIDYRTIGVVFIKNFQIEKGTTKTLYEPYTNGPSPNPDYPQPIQVVSGDNEINVCGRNLLDNENPTLVSSTATWIPTETGGKFTNSGTWGDGVQWRFNVDTNISYTLSANVGGSNLFLYIRTYTDNTYSTVKTTYLTDARGSISKTFTPDSKYLMIRLANNASISNVETTNIQLEKSNQATTYEPYTGEGYEIDLPSGMELCKIGTYQDYIYKDNGSWYLHKEVGKAIIELITALGTLPNGNKYLALNVPNKVFLSTREAYCTNASMIRNGTAEASDGEFYDNPGNFVFVGNSSDTKETLKAKYDGALLYYQLATPTNTLIEDTTLLNQLEAIKMSYEGQTNLSQTNNDLPFILNPSALKKV